MLRRKVIACLRWSTCSGRGGRGAPASPVAWTRRPSSPGRPASRRRSGPRRRAAGRRSRRSSPSPSGSPCARRARDDPVDREQAAADVDVCVRTRPRRSTLPRKLCMSKKLPSNVKENGIVGKPAAPTVAPGGRPAAADWSAVRRPQARTRAGRRGRRARLLVAGGVSRVLCDVRSGRRWPRGGGLRGGVGGTGVRRARRSSFTVRKSTCGLLGGRVELVDERRRRRRRPARPCRARRRWRSRPA